MRWEGRAEQTDTGRSAVILHDSGFIAAVTLPSVAFNIACVDSLPGIISH